MRDAYMRSGISQLSGVVTFPALARCLEFHSGWHLDLC